MGSFAAQQFVLDHSQEIDGLALSGSGDLDQIARAATSAPPRTSLLNAAFEPARTPFDGLSRDTEVVDAFMNDPLCLHNFSLRPWHPSSRLRLDCLIRSVFGKYAPSCLFTCFPAAKIRSVSTLKESKS
jgi:alpha-beta hydrolase superfamily lysophospholipase